MDEYYQSHERKLINELDRLHDNREKIDRIIVFIVDVRSTLSEDVEQWIKKTLPLCRQENYEKGLFSLYIHLAFYYLMNSYYPLGKSYLEKASQIDWTRFINSRDHMYFYHAHGLYYHFTGDDDLAIEYFEKSLELARRLRDDDFICQMLNNLSGYHLKNGEYRKGEALLLEAFAIINPEKNPFPALKIMDNLAYLYILLGQYEKAVDFLDSALSYARDKHIKYMYPPLHYNYAMVYERKGDTDKADEYYRLAYENNGDTYFTEDIPLGYIKFLFGQGRVDEGRLVTDETIELFRKKGLACSLDKVYHLMDEYDI